MEERMHRFELYARDWLENFLVAGIHPTEMLGDPIAASFASYRYVWHVPAQKADAFRDALRIKIAQHNQHFNMPQLTVFESIGWGFSQP